MSAALVESVREAERLENVSGAWHEADVARNALDLPAILAALTEAEALRAQIAAGQAREVALREALATIKRDAALHSSADDSVCECATCKCWDIALIALSAPTDTAALRAFGERVVAETMSAMSGEYGDAQRDGCDPNGAWDCACEVKASEIVDRVLGGS